jgi:uncharacterized membrane protein YagU involved in acid resistance
MVNPLALRKYGERFKANSSTLTKDTTSILWTIYSGVFASGFVVLFEVFAVIQVILNFVMMSITSLYFHTILEKIIGVTVSLMAWYLTYNVVYYYCQCDASQGKLNPLSQKK